MEERSVCKFKTSTYWNTYEISDGKCRYCGSQKQVQNKDVTADHSSSSCVKNKIQHFEGLIKVQQERDTHKSNHFAEECVHKPIVKSTSRLSMRAFEETQTTEPRNDAKESYVEATVDFDKEKRDVSSLPKEAKSMTAESSKQEEEVEEKNKDLSADDITTKASAADRCICRRCRCSNSFAVRTCIMCNSSRRSSNKKHSDKQPTTESNVSSEPQAGHEQTAIKDNKAYKDMDKLIVKTPLRRCVSELPSKQEWKIKTTEGAGLGNALTNTETFNKEVKELIHDTCCGSDELLDYDIILVCPPNDQHHLKIEERLRKLPIFKEPQHLIYSDKHNKLALNDDVITQISSIDLPLSIVAICGKYRTGKSYLMNKLANKEQVVGFKIGHTVSSQTKGIWAWCKPHPKQTDTVLLLLDVEGMADVKKEGDNDHDIKLFCLTNLLSSVIIYNHQGIFDQDSLEKLSFITRMTENIRNTDDLAPDVNDETLRLVTPIFIMCLRDFHLQLKEDNRRFKDADEYFESIIELSAEPGHESNDKTKMCIQKYYPKRKCFIIRQPAMNEHLTRLEELDEKQLDKSFLVEVNNLKEFVYGCKPKLLDAVTNKFANGLAIEAFARTYVDALANGVSMTFSTAFIRASKIHNSKLVIKLVHDYKKEVDMISLPKKKKQDLQDKCFELQNEKLRIFRRQSYPYDKWHFEDKARAKMETIANEKMNENSEKVQSFFTQILASIHEESMQRHATKYQDSGLSMIKEVENLFLLETKGFDNHEQEVAFHKYKKSIKHEHKKAEPAAKLRDEEIQYGKLREYREERNAYSKRIQEEAIDTELTELEQNYNKAMGKDAKKGHPFLNWLKGLFRREKKHF